MPSTSGNSSTSSNGSDATISPHMSRLLDAFIQSGALENSILRNRTDPPHLPSHLHLTPISDTSSTSSDSPPEEASVAAPPPSPQQASSMADSAPSSFFDRAEMHAMPGKYHCTNCGGMPQTVVHNGSDEHWACREEVKNEGFTSPRHLRHAFVNIANSLLDQFDDEYNRWHRLGLQFCGLLMKDDTRAEHERDHPQSHAALNEFSGFAATEKVLAIKELIEFRSRLLMGIKLPKELERANTILAMTRSQLEKFTEHVDELDRSVLYATLEERKRTRGMGSFGLMKPAIWWILSLPDYDRESGREYPWPRRSSLTRSPDTVSPIYPDRPIRPLPKNRLRSKLSPEQAGSIVYPPEPPTSSPLFSFPYGLMDKTDGQTNGHREHNHNHVSNHHTQCTCGGDHDLESEEEEITYENPSYRWSSPVDGSRLDSVQKKLLEVSRASGKAPPPPASTASSADGYESFENTSNKKKRKIPLSGSSSVHQTSLSAEMANMGISSHGSDGTFDDANGEGPGNYHNHTLSPSSAGTGISGAGRGRYGRQASRSERRPLGGTSTSSLNGHPPNFSAKSRWGNWKGDGTKTKQNGDQGIISAAIASAAEQSPSTPQKGKENISLLSQQSSKSATPKTQFTFTCESDSSNKMVWPGQEHGAPHTPTPSAQYAGSGYPKRQTAIRSKPYANSHPSNTGVPVAAPGHSATAPAQAPSQNPPSLANDAPPKKTRPRKPSKEYALAARQRRLQQEYNNFHHKPTKETMWICEFCEYEDIWGKPPKALIRQYEIKDRAERQKAEEKRRLLEKAKMKNRKGKKGGKGAKNATQPTPPTNSGQHYDQPLDNVPLPPDPQGEEYYDDEYDDGYDPADPVSSTDPRYAGGYEYAPPGDGGGTTPVEDNHADVGAAPANAPAGAA